MQDGDLVDLEVERPTRVQRQRRARARHDGEALEGMISTPAQPRAERNDSEE